MGNRRALNTMQTGSGGSSSERDQRERSPQEQKEGEA
jgi:hypothetical protein